MVIKNGLKREPRKESHGRRPSKKRKHQKEEHGK
jgi:hypothetical protein